MSILKQMRLAQAQPHLRRRPTLEELKTGVTGADGTPPPADGQGGEVPEDGAPAPQDTPKEEAPVDGAPTETPSEEPEPAPAPEKITFEDPADLNISRVMQAEQDIRDEARRIGGDEEHLSALSEDQRQVELTQLTDAAEATTEALHYMTAASMEGAANVHLTSLACQINARSRQRAKLGRQVLPSVESIRSIYDGRRQLQAIQEGLFDTIREIWDAIWGLIRRGWEWLVKFIKNLFSTAGQQVVAMRSLMTQIKANRRKRGTSETPDDLDMNVVKTGAHMRVEEAVYLPLAVDGAWPWAPGHASSNMQVEMAQILSLAGMHRHLLNVVDADLLDQIEQAHSQRLVNLKAATDAALNGTQAQLAVLPAIKFAPGDFYLMSQDDALERVYPGGVPVQQSKELSGVKAPDNFLWVRTKKMLGDVQLAFLVPEEHVQAKGRSVQANAETLIQQLGNWDVRMVVNPKTPINDGMTPYYTTKTLEECTEFVMNILDELALMARNVAKLDKIKDLFGKKIEAMRKQADELHAAFGQLDQPAQMKMAHMPLMVQYNREIAQTMAGLSKAVNNYYMGIGSNVRQTCSAWGQYLSLLRRYEERL